MELPRNEFPFWYASDPISGADGATVPAVIKTDSDSAFLWTKLSYWLTGAAGDGVTDSTRPCPNALLTLSDSGVAGSLTQPYGGVPLCAIAGDGRLPGVLSQPYLIGPNRTITLQFALLEDIAGLVLVLHGVRRLLTMQG